MARTSRGIQKDLVSLLCSRGVYPTKTPVFLMRHADKRYPDLFRHIGTRALTLYQAVQQRRYKPGDLIVGFFGNRAGHALLLGVWRVDECILTSVAKKRGLLDGAFEFHLGRYYHELAELDLLHDVRLKLEVTWGKELVWRRVLRQTNSYPIQIREGCPVPFQGLSSVSLVMAELRLVLGDIEWKTALGGVAGVYLIADEREGRQYIGSASGGLGILQRWSEYAKTGHGGNKKLIALLRGNSSRENDFRFTLLETFPRDTANAHAIMRENYWKLALGTRAHGLNAN